MAPALKTLTSGPWTGVRAVQSPFAANAQLLLGAENGRLLNGTQGGGFYARPGFARPRSIVNNSNASQGVYCHQAWSGTNYNFLFVDGKVWRWSTDLTSAPVDVTPTNVSISTGKFVYATSLNDSIIVNDGVNKPWIGTNLGSTPITATVIEQQTPANVLSIGSNDVRLANTAFTGTWSGTQATFAANAVGTAVGALGQIAANTWGILLVEASNATTLVFTAAFNAGAGYATEALAIAALPARTLGRRYVGYVTMRADAGAVWIAGTDAFATGTTGNQAQTTNYYAGEGPAYSVFGQPVIYYGAVFVIYQQIETVYARTTIGWSEPNQPSVGYQQTDYDNQWTLTQTSSDPLYALAPTNDALYYFRQLSVGAVAGAPGISFQGTATHDVVAANVGCTAPKTVCVVRNVVYFCDVNGRPWRFAVGGTVEPIWEQVIQATTSPVTVPSYVAPHAWAIVDPNLNLYLAAPWPVAGSAAGVPSYTSPPATLYAFDVDTGVYQGTWQLALQSAATPVLEVGGVLRDAYGSPIVTILQANVGGAAYVWRQYREWEQTWLDNAVLPNISVTTPRVFYSGTETRRANQMRVLHGFDNGGTGGIPNTAATIATPAQSSVSLAARAATDTSQASTGRTVFALDAAVTRGMSFTVTAQTATNQWRAWAVEVDVSPDATATVEDF